MNSIAKKQVSLSICVCAFIVLSVHASPDKTHFEHQNVPNDNVLTESMLKTQKSHRSSAVSQQRIENLSEQTTLKVDHYLLNERQSDITDAYNAQLKKLIASQLREVDDIQLQIDSIEETERAVLPMLNTMVAGLQEFVTRDTPFLLSEREGRVNKLTLLLDRADVSVAEKYRQILEAYMVEVGYGRTIEAYSGVIGQENHHVNFLRMGRVALYYQSLNGLKSALWLPKNKSWQHLSDAQNQVLAKAIQIARQQRVPELINLPLPPLVKES